MYSIRHYVIKFVSDKSVFSQGTPVSSTNKTDRHDITEILLKVALSTKSSNLVTLVTNSVIYAYSISNFKIPIIS